MADARLLTREELEKANEQLQEMVQRLQSDNNMLRELIIRMSMERYNVR